MIEFASGGEIVKTVAQVGGVSKFRVQNTIFNDFAMSSMRCKLCPPRDSRDQQQCYPIKCNHRNRWAFFGQLKFILESKL